MHESGRDYRFMLLDGNRVEEQIKSNIGYDMPMVFLSGARKYLRLMQSAPHLFVVMSLRGDQDGIPSVVCDDEEGICGLMSALRELGHRRIALLSSHSSDPLGQISSWRQAMGGEYSPELYLQMPQTQGALMDDARRVVREALQKTSFSALFTLGDELSVGAFAGINDCGLRVPEDISVVSITDSQLHRNLCPDVTVYDPDLAGHVRGALSMLEANAANPDGIELLRRIKPVLYFRGSSAGCALPLQQFPEF
jgi:LacI family transcriptional regulator